MMNVIESAMIYANRVLMHPGDRQYWQIDISETSSTQKLASLKEVLS